MQLDVRIDMGKSPPQSRVTTNGLINLTVTVEFSEIHIFLMMTLKGQIFFTSRLQNPISLSNFDNFIKTMKFIQIYSL